MIAGRIDCLSCDAGGEETVVFELGEFGGEGGDEGFELLEGEGVVGVGGG